MTHPIERSAPRVSQDGPAMTIAELDEDPHGIFRRMRPVTPIITRDDGGYLLIRARDFETFITDPRTRQIETELVRSRGVTSGPLFQFFDETMLLSNGPKHRRRRAPLSRAFGYRVVEALRRHIRATAAEIVDNRLEGREMDVLTQYAALVPSRVISDILGIDRKDAPRFTEWVYTMSRALSASYQAADVPEIEHAAALLGQYVDGLLLERRRERRDDDFLSSFIAAVEEEGKLSPSEAMVQIMSVVVGGSDTTRGALTILVSTLLQHRELWDALCNDPGLIPGAVLESLRYEPIVGTVPRITLEDIEIDGYTIPVNKILILSSLSALRDPDVYAEPDTFDIRRTDHPARHPAFGGGVHRCLGETLARAELEESLAVLLERLPNLQMIGPPTSIRGHSGIRRITGLRVGWR